MFIIDLVALFKAQGSVGRGGARAYAVLRTLPLDGISKTTQGAQRGRVSEGVGEGGQSGLRLEGGAE